MKVAVSYLKTPYSKEETKMDLTNYNYVTKNDAVKFVCGDMNDLIRSKEIIYKYNLQNKTNCIFSPVFGAIELAEIVNFLKENTLNDIRLQLQIHKFIWDKNKRGV